jgi:hypothetical protein
MLLYATAFLCPSNRNRTRFLLDWLPNPWLHGVMNSTHKESLPDLKTLEIMSVSELRTTYHAYFKYSPPKHSRESFLRYNLAWARQALDQGHDPIVLRKSLIKQLEAALGVDSGKPQLSSGTRLIREWKGTVYEVNVTESGYEWEGHTYKSLSPIATAITGTRWSGPRFFGIKGQADVSYKSSGALL